MGDDDGGDDAETTVKVFIRIRPLNKREISEKQTIGWNYNKTAMLEETPNGVRVYSYDQVFGLKSNNADTYALVGKPVLIKAM